MFSKKTLIALAFFFIASVAASTAHAESAPPKVVVSIKPIELIATAVMKGVSTPDLLLDVNVSPHTATLKPSQARKLEQADVVVRIGRDLEGFLDKPFEALAGKAAKLSLLEAKGIRFPEEKETDHDHAEHSHEHGRDPHIWLDPQNALIMAGEIARVLSETDPANAASYLANTAAFTRRVFDLERKLKQQLEPYATTRFITLHDGYGHFYERFGLKGGQAVSISDQDRPGASTVRTLQAYITKYAVRCAFVEPQNSSKVMDLITANGAVRTETIDPLGGNLSAGKASYENLLSRLADTLAGCLRVR